MCAAPRDDGELQIARNADWTYLRYSMFGERLFFPEAFKRSLLPSVSFFRRRLSHNCFERFLANNC